MAQLVHYASETQGHIPTDTPSITELLAELRDARLGVAGMWLQRHIRTFRAGQAFDDDKMTAKVLWDTMVAAAQRDGEHNEKGPKPTCWGWDRSRVMRDVRKMHNLPTQKPVRGTDGKKGTGWRGVLLMECGDTCAACEARPEESAGDINPASTPPVLYIAKQIGTDIDAPWEYFPTDIPPFRYVIKDDGEKEWVLTPVQTGLEGEALIVPGTLNEEGEWVPDPEAVETLQGVADLAGGGDVYRDGEFSSFDIGPLMTYHVYSGPVGMWHKAREFGLLPGEECEECSEAMRRSHAPFKDQGALDGMPAPTREKH